MHGFLTFLFLINGYWLALILNLPLLAWNIKKCVWLVPRTDACMRDANPPDRIVENTHLLDATEIFRKLNVHKKVRRGESRGCSLGAVANTTCRSPLLSWVSTLSCSSSTCTA